jgi:hypothetical protein
MCHKPISGAVYANSSPLNVTESVASSSQKSATRVRRSHRYWWTKDRGHITSWKNWSGALFRSDGAKRGPTLLDVLAAAVWARDCFLAVLGDGQNSRKGFVAGVAEEFVLGHTASYRLEW